VLAQNRLVAKRSGAPKRSEGGFDLLASAPRKEAIFLAIILFRLGDGGRLLNFGIYA
jgi:hypothetical protein